jgi:hypothetical protein
LAKHLAQRLAKQMGKAGTEQHHRNTRVVEASSTKAMEASSMALSNIKKSSKAMEAASQIVEASIQKATEASSISTTETWKGAPKQWKRAAFQLQTMEASTEKMEGTQKKSSKRAEHQSDRSKLLDTKNIEARKITCLFFWRTNVTVT